MILITHRLQPHHRLLPIIDHDRVRLKPSENCLYPDLKSALGKKEGEKQNTRKDLMQVDSSGNH